MIRESQRGARARAWLESDIYRETWKKLEDDTIRRWRDSPVRDTEGQAMLRLKMQVLDQLRKEIEQVAYTGKLAEQTINEERSRMQRARDAVRGVFRKAV